MPDRPSENSSGSFLTHVTQLVSGNVAAQALTVLSLPILSRLFAPQAMGLASLFMSLTTLIGVLACLRYELSIMLPDTDGEAANLLGVCLITTLVVTLLTFLSLPAIEHKILPMVSAEKLTPYLPLVPLAILVNGFFLALNYWNSRTKHFGRLAVAKLTSAVLHNTVRLGGGFMGYVTSGILIVSAILGQLVTTLVLGAQIVRDHRQLFRESIRIPHMVAGLKRHWKFPIFSSGSMVLNTLSFQLPAWFLAFYFSPEIVGYFALCRLVLGMPMTLIGMSVTQVFFQRASEAATGGEDMTRVVSGVFRRLVAMGLFPFLLLTLIGNDMFGFIFGAPWREAGVFAQILSMAIFAQFISSPLTTMFAVMEKQGIHLMMDIFLFGTRLAALIIGGMRGDVKLALLLYAGAGIAYYVLFHLWLVVALKMPWTLPLKPFVTFGMIALLPLTLPAIAKWQFALAPIWVLLAGGLGIVPYYGMVLMKDSALKQPVQNVLNKIGRHRIRLTKVL